KKVARSHGDNTIILSSQYGSEDESVPSPVRQCLMASGLALTVFALIAIAWTQFGGVRDFDESIAERLNGWARSSTWVPETFLAITYLGSARFLIGLSIVVIGCLLILRRWRLAIAVCGTQLISVA